MQPDAKAEPQKNVETNNQPPAARRLPYAPPVLTKYGDAVTLTRGGAALGGSDNTVASVA